MAAVEGTGFSFRPLAEEDARAISTWEYEEACSVYDVHDVERLLRPDYHYCAALSEDGELLGYCCFGEDARAEGMEEEPGVLDVCGRLRPDLTGVGLGAPFLRAVCAHSAEQFQPRALRLSVVAFDRRARYMAAALGFEQVGLRSAAGRDYVVLQRQA
jgi:RimJ/RimL family protein N-acetyltransferase